MGPTIALEGRTMLARLRRNDPGSWFQGGVERDEREPGPRRCRSPGYDSLKRVASSEPPVASPALYE
jgi:hypothetical protein